MKFVLGLIIGFLIIPVAAFFFFKFGNPPVAVADAPFPFERQIVKVPLHARIDRDRPHTVPIEATPQNLIAGAQVYHAQCAECHGVYGHHADFAAHMYPSVPQLWQPHLSRPSVVGVSDDPAGETYWKVANGIRLTGMPSFDHVLSSTQMWQVALLLKHAADPLPPAAVAILQQPMANSSTDPAPTPKAQASTPKAPVKTSRP